MPAMFALGVLATLAGGRVEVEPSEGWREGTNLFVVVATDPGSRKSAVLRDMTAPLLGLERLLLEEVRPDLAQRASLRRVASRALARAENATVRDPGGP